MNQCVPSWDLDDNPTPPHPSLALRGHSNSNSLASDVPRLDYEVAELTWENGQLAMHGLGPPRLSSKTTAISCPNKYSWDKPLAGGTLESIVNQATTVPHPKPAMDGGGHDGDEQVQWFDENRRVTPTGTASITLTMDALVPCSNPRNNQERFTQVLESLPTCVVGCSTRVDSCSGGATLNNPREARLARVRHEGSSRPDQSVSGSATCGPDSRQVTLDTCEREFGTAVFTSTSLGSPENTSSDKQCTRTVDDHDSACHSRNQRETGKENKKKGTGKLSVSTKRSRAAAIHNQSERKRRDKINQRMKTLQKLVPNSSKTDKASMLDEVIEYLKQLQAQVHMMSRMNMSTMMLPLAMQQQLQMSMMAPMGMGLGVMDMNTMAGRANIAGMSPHVLHPTAFMPAPVTSWDATGDRLASAAAAMQDPLSAFIACQSQPMTMDAYSRMAAFYQQFQQPAPGPVSKNKVT